MKKIILFIATIALATAAYAVADYADVVYLLEGKVYPDDRVEFYNVSAVYGQESHFPTLETGYYFELLSCEKEVLYKNNLGISFAILSFNQTITENNLEYYSLYERIPYYPGAGEIRIYHAGKEILAVDLALFCDKDGVCDAGENECNCAADCAEQEESEGDGAGILQYFPHAAAILIVAAVILLYRKREADMIKNERKELFEWKKAEKDST